MGAAGAPSRRPELPRRRVAGPAAPRWPATPRRGSCAASAGGRPNPRRHRPAPRRPAPAPRRDRGRRPHGAATPRRGPRPRHLRQRLERAPGVFREARFEQSEALGVEIVFGDEAFQPQPVQRMLRRLGDDEAPASCRAPRRSIARCASVGRSTPEPPPAARRPPPAPRRAFASGQCRFRRGRARRRRAGRRRFHGRARRKSQTVSRSAPASPRPPRRRGRAISAPPCFSISSASAPSRSNSVARARLSGGRQAGNSARKTSAAARRPSRD